MTTTKNIFRSFYILTGIIGVLINMGFLSGGLSLWTLNYYTVLSNILCIAYVALRVYYDNSNVADTRFKTFITSHLTKYAVTMCIMLTFLVYHFLLNPVWESNSSALDMQSVGNYIVHYIIPVLTLVDFLIFDRLIKPLKWYAPFVWMIIPITYFIYILLRAPLFGNIGTTASPYPYPFIDFTIQSVSSVFLNITAILFVFIILGYILLGIDHLILKTGKQKRTDL